MEFNKIIKLLIKRHRNELSQSDQEELGHWLKQSDHQHQAKQWDQLWELSGQYKASYQPDLEAGLSRLQNRMKPRPARRRGLRLALALAAVFLLALLPLSRAWWMPTNSEMVLTSGDEPKEYSLPDGSRVQLRENSRISYSSNWKNSRIRALSLEGEAFFQVVSDPSRPFEVRTSQTQVQVLGTAFNLRAYPAEPLTTLTVEEGLVAFSAMQGEQEIQLGARQKALFDHQQQILSRVKGVNLNARSWQTGRLRFRGTPLREVIRELDEHLAVDLILENQTLSECSFTFGSAQGESVNELLENLAISFKAKLEKLDKGRFVLRGGHCNR